MAHIEERNQDATLYISGLTDDVDEALLWELMVQAGPVGMFFFYIYIYFSLILTYYFLSECIYS